MIDLGARLIFFEAEFLGEYTEDIYMNREYEDIRYQRCKVEIYQDGIIIYDLINTSQYSEHYYPVHLLEIKRQEIEKKILFITKKFFQLNLIIDRNSAKTILNFLVNEYEYNRLPAMLEKLKEDSLSE